MKIAIILNGISHQKGKFYRDILPALQHAWPIEVHETKAPDHAQQLAKELTLTGVNVLLVAGGDGTLNQVINGMINANTVLPLLGIIPLGSGNDFATLLKLTSRPDELINLINNQKHLAIDVGKISCKTKDGADTYRFFINVASLGMGPATVKRVEKWPRFLGGGFRYMISVLDTFLTHPTEMFEVVTAGWNFKGKARVIAVANGRSFGNKIFIAPDAHPCDGIFSTFIANNMPLYKFLLTLIRVKQGKKIKNTTVHYNTSNKLRITSPKQSMIECEGEMAGYLPAIISLHAKQVNVLSSVKFT